MNDLEARLWQEILNLLAEDRKIEAIKRYREMTGAGLADAKAAVERIAEDTPPVLPQKADAVLEMEIVSLLGRGQKIAAIKLYRERTSSGLKAAKEAVEAIGSRHGMSAPAGAGCLSMFALLAILWAGMTLAWLGMT